ncbi:Zn-ribbon domain-containing OB-fold protein [Desulfatibacillum aliphaticivorans]|uniref:DUF35 domain-containing protein n=1 Tax=Desulfatibacillum aliphaticivorans TaxID=218208 RepID=B8FM83_DESAL|nr:Zn-ribbon domain-containing OB-fold protein [Desulfatibacillum aliphaticivorans]ACL05921.1 protein of unknown function DUF35 [Desulfatibacillum aliphaticivorans]
MSYNDLTPTPDADSKPFWEGCRNHELLFQKCAACGEIRWPPGILCPHCHSREVEMVRSGGKGTIYSYVIYHQPFHPEFADKVPYVVAIVELEEGPMLITNIVECPHESLACDMPVRVHWDDVSEECTLPKFRPV